MMRECKMLLIKRWLYHSDLARTLLFFYQQEQFLIAACCFVILLVCDFCIYTWEREQKLRFLIIWKLCYAVGRS